MNKRSRMQFPWVAVLTIFSLSAHSTEVFFTPSTACEDRIAQEIAASQEEVVAAVYALNNPKIVSALVAAHDRGLKIRILTDGLQAAGRSSRVLALREAGLNLRVHSKHKIEHNKFGWFDGKVAVTGSFNWTAPASAENSENCVFLTEAPVLAAFKNRFEELWSLNTSQRSEAKLERIRTRRLASGGSR